MLTGKMPAQLYVKSFFSASIPDAMVQACHELGPDALLIGNPSV
jgi:hypothetical protein